MRRATALLAGVLLLPLLGTTVLAREIDPAERREHDYEASIPPCDDPAVIADIANDFSTRESRFWNSSLKIVHFERIRQLAWRPWGLDYVPRRFCSGTVLTSDGVKRRVDYSVREDLGTIGITWGTEWCVAGLDRHYAFAPGCKQARP
jgi:hypothetical protein